MLCQFLILAFVVAGNFDYDRKKKLSVGGKLAVFLLWREIFITTGKKKDTLRPEKKDTVVCLAGCAVVSVCGSGRKLACFL